MKTTTRLLWLCLLAASPVYAQEKSSPEARMREALRQVTLQARTLQTEKDELALRKEEAEQQSKALDGQVKALVKRAGEEKEALDSLKARLGEEEGRTQRLTVELEKWKAACLKASDIAKAREAECAALVEKNAVLQNTVTEQKRRNLALHKIGMEILKRYEGFGLGTAISAREPFVGVTRVKLENLIQNYSDQLNEQRIKK